MTPERYQAAATLAGLALLRFRARPEPIGQVTGNERNAVYMVCDRTGRVRYVGSTIGRPARHRISEHLSGDDRVRFWHEAWVVPLRATTTPPLVRAIEGRIGRFLRPADTRCLPRSRAM